MGRAVKKTRKKGIIRGVFVQATKKQNKKKREGEFEIKNKYIDDIRYIRPCFDRPGITLLEETLVDEFIYSKSVRPWPGKYFPNKKVEPYNRVLFSFFLLDVGL